VDADTVIRPFAAADAPALSVLYRRSVAVLGPRDYGPEQVSAWLSGAPTPESVRARYDVGRIALVAAERGGRPLAFGDVERDGHVDLLFCAPEAAGTGVASALYDALEAAARAGGRGRLHVEASEAARRLLARKGFRVVARRDFEIDGVPIHNYAMEKILARPET
jgi:putative acetyltransferase